MYTESQVASERRDPKALALAGGILLAALGAAFAGTTGLLALRIGALTLPSWSMYVVAVGLVGAAALVAYMSEVQLCAQCGGEWQQENAYFPLENRAEVVGAVINGDIDTLRALPVVPKNQMKMHLNVFACSKCGETGTLDLTRWEDFRQHDEIPERKIQGPSVRALRDLTRAHARARGDEDIDE